MPRRHSTLVGGTILALGLIAAFAFGRPSPSLAKASATGDRIGVIYVEGVITDAAPSSNPFGMGGEGATSLTIVEKLDQALKTDEIKAVVLRVNSPGGSAAGSQEIYNAINRLKAKKPVYISMADIAASGGYYIAAPATKIYATPATLTGSIGVIMELPRWDALLDKIGIDVRTMKAGLHKDIGSPVREMTPEEVAIIQGLLTTTHNQFIKAVDAGRANLDETQVRALADGTIWTGEDALAAGLVDELGGLRECLDYAAAQAGLPADDYVVDEFKTSFLDELLGEEMEFRSPMGQLGGMVQLLGMMQALNAVGGAQPLALGTPTGFTQGPQTAMASFASQLYLCQPLAGSLGIQY